MYFSPASEPLERGSCVRCVLNLSERSSEAAAAPHMCLFSVTLTLFNIRPAVRCHRAAFEISSAHLKKNNTNKASQVWVSDASWTPEKHKVDLNTRTWFYFSDTVSISRSRETNELVANFLQRCFQFSARCSCSQLTRLVLSSVIESNLEQIEVGWDEQLWQLSQTLNLQQWLHGTQVAEMTETLGPKVQIQKMNRSIVVFMRNCVSGQFITECYLRGLSTV